MCLFGSSEPKPAPTPPAPARAPASLDLSDMEQTPSAMRKRRAQGKRGIRNKTSSTGMNMGGSSAPSLNIPSNNKSGY